MGEIIRCIRVIKMNAWEESFTKTVSGKYCILLLLLLVVVLPFIFLKIQQQYP